jgi:hypothetical protein
MTVRLTPHRVRRYRTAAGSPPPQAPDELVTIPTDGLAEPKAEVEPHAASGASSFALCGDPAGTEPAIGIDGGTGNGNAGSDSRIALREVRRQRRRTAWLCAVVVAVCLGLTIAVVGLARTRPAPPGIIASYASALPSTPVPGGTSLPSDPHPGAPASEGGNR